MAREAVAAERRRVLAGPAAPADVETLATRVVQAGQRAGLFSLRPVINAQGVVLHTNLGRAVLSPLALERVDAGGAASGVGRWGCPPGPPTATAPATARHTSGRRWPTVMPSS